MTFSTLLEALYAEIRAETRGIAVNLGKNTKINENTTMQLKHGLICWRDLRMS